MGSHEKDYWRPWAENLLLELNALGLSLTEDNFGGIYYDDLVPCLQNNISEAETEFKDNLRIKALKEFWKHRGLLSAGNTFVKKWANAIVDSFGDIFTYLYTEHTHKAVNQRVYEGLNRATSHMTIIGHSLGSIVGFCALAENHKAACLVDHLIMIGSPFFWFTEGVARHVNFAVRPKVGRFTNIAGILDIAWPQKLPEIVSGLNENIVFKIDMLNPISGHLKYFNTKRSLSLIASEVLKGWN